MSDNINQSPVYIPGQRWISNSESELGLGVIQESTARTITIYFPATDTVRTYALDQAPLSRVNFYPGDTITDIDNRRLKINEVIEENGLLRYLTVSDDGDQVDVNESELSASIKLNRPQDRLFTAQFDPEKAYILRHETLQQKNRLMSTDVSGLYGARIDLIPHQLYIGYEVARRPAPRVLLADEVGLGKTIEAGIILHHQLITGRASRVLVIVPDALVHQWLVEMLRRFNLKFSIFNEDRSAALNESEANPFHSEQLVLCSLDFVMQNPVRHQQLVEGDWDMLIIDEAHHLQWEKENVSEEYKLVEKIAEKTPGVLLLTATPEQLGPSSHFARLRLLDSHRFHDLDLFMAEEEHYSRLADTAEALIENKNLTKSDLKILEEFIPSHEHDLLTTTRDGHSEEQRKRILDILIDQHGTGRILFRNTRHAIKGFPERNLNGYALEACNAYAPLFAEIFHSSEKQQQFAKEFNHSFAELMLTPELVYQALKELGLSKLKDQPDWHQVDPRVDWLVSFLSSEKNQKILIICAHAHTALELEDFLKNRHAIKTAVFHEQMSIIERDRAAAYFADMEEGAQVLICSEIGSEGRNFQFSHNLVLFDLPLNPDLLEQRIGRLDRIGQKQVIQIHVPYIKESAQETLYHWYKEGLNIFIKTCPAAQGMVRLFGDELEKLLIAPAYNVDQVIDLLDRAGPALEKINLELQKGRDRLLELNAFRKPVATRLVNEIHKLDNDEQLKEYMLRVCDTYGLEVTEHSQNSYVLEPGNHMLTPHFPELPADGVTVTFNREQGLTHEDRMFLTWEHPMVSGAMDMVFEGEHGNVTFSIIKNKHFSAGTVLLEMLYTVQCVAPVQLQVERFMPAKMIRLLLDKNNEDHSEVISFEECKSLVPAIDAHTCQQVVTTHSDRLKASIIHAEHVLSHNLPLLITEATDEINTQLNSQVSRLRNLQKYNPNVRDDEIEQLQIEQQQLLEYIQYPQIRLDALRLIVCG